MFSDHTLELRVSASLEAATVPPVDLSAIRRRSERIEAPRAVQRHFPRAATAVAAALIAVLLITAKAPAIVQDVSRAALIALGIEPQPPVPRRIIERMHAQAVSLGQARRMANFDLVPPAGLPADASMQKIFLNKSGAWSKATGKWSVDGTQVTFTYARKDGRTFAIIAGRYSAQAGPWPRWIFDADSARSVNGKLHMERYENFIWRNGNQAMRITQGPSISALEIKHIRSAMQGLALPQYNDGSRLHRGRGKSTIYILPK